MTQTPTHQPNPVRRFWGWLPTTVTRPVIVFAWLSLALQIILVGTGGAVRLTASGLGCPTWPQCSAGSLVTTPELGIHGIIEFSNRMLTVVLSIVVILMFVIVLRMLRPRPDLFGIALAQALSIPFQAVLGGITVLSGLNPYVVGSHFLVSIVLVVLTVNLVYRAYHAPHRTRRLVPRWYGALVVLTAIFVGFTIILGVLTTGSGPHAGDNSNAKALAPRNGLPPLLLQNIHEIPAFIVLALTVILVLIALVSRDRACWRCVRVYSIGLLVIEIAQIIVGLTQAKLGLPIALVNIHLVLASLLVAALTALSLSLRTSAKTHEV